MIWELFSVVGVLSTLKHFHQDFLMPLKLVIRSPAALDKQLPVRSVSLLKHNRKVDTAKQCKKNGNA